MLTHPSLADDFRQALALSKIVLEEGGVRGAEASRNRKASHAFVSHNAH
jgi:hypothetical protein